MSLITASHHPALTLKQDATVLEACQHMKERGVGAVAITDAANHPVGIFTERDAIHKVITTGLDAATTKLSQVMTSPCLTIPSDRTVDDALAVMVKKSVHHLALINEDRELIGMVSYRTLMREHIDYLNAEVDSMSAYMGTEGMGGD